jgi:hypothetical protein|tara:strand:+ start:494 stop:877 length:384 start_codon:yes stop_codon:yes gene_type:complete
MGEYERAMDYIKAWKKHPSRSPYQRRRYNKTDMAHVRQMQQRRVDSLECNFDMIFDGILAKNKIAKTMGLIENRPRMGGKAIDVQQFDWLEQRLLEIEKALNCAANKFGGSDNQPSVEDERKHGWKY